MSSDAPAKPLPVSAVLICGASAPGLEQTLSALVRCDEVLIYFNGETGDLQSRASRFPNVTACEGEFLGFGPTKQAAVERARNDWVFCVDTDEWPDERLLQAIADIDFDRQDTAYTVLRKNRFLGRHVARGGWGNDVLLRVFHREAAGFNDRPVHEKVETRPGIESRELAGVLWHDAVTDLDQFLQKISRYSELNAGAGRGAHPWVALLRAQFAFFRSYVLQLGVLAGWRGLVIAYARSVGTFFKYAKRYARRAADSQSD